MVRQASCDVCDRNDKSSPDTAWQILGWRSRLLSWTPTSAQTPAPAPASKERRSTRSRETFAKSFAGSSLPPSFWDPSEPGCGSSLCPRRRRAQTLPGPPQAPGCPQAASVYPPEEGMEGTAPPPRSGAWHGPITAGKRRAGEAFSIPSMCPGKVFSTSFLRPGEVLESALHPSSSPPGRRVSGGLFFTGVV